MANSTRSLSLGKIATSSLLVLLLTVTGHSHGPEMPPRLECVALAADETSHAPGDVVTVSNLKPIDLRAILTGPNVAALDTMRVDGGSTVTATAPPTLAVTVAQVSGETRTAVETRIIRTGSGMRPGRREADLLLEIPLDTAKRRQNIELLIQKVETEAQTTGRAEEFKMHKRLMIQSLEQLYMENRGR